MRARRRDRTRASGTSGSTGDQPRTRAGGDGQRTNRRRSSSGGGASSGGGNAGNKRRGSNQRGRRRGRGRARQPQGPGFWGDAGALPEDQPDIRITDAPAAVPRSLGRPPLPGHETIAEHYFGAVYERAVATASALAAAGGLLDPEALLDQGDDD